MIRVPITFPDLQPLALRADDAAAMLSISRMTLWRRVKLGEITKLSCGTYAVEELRRYASSQPVEVENPKIVRKKLRNL